MAFKAVVLGAGPAGMSAAVELVRAGVEVEVVEKESVVGGLCRSTRKDGFIFDLGGHRFITKDEVVLKFVEDLMKDEILLRQRKSVIRLQGKYFNYPLEFLDVITKMPFWISFKAAFDFFVNQLYFAKDNDVSFEDWVVKRFGKTMYEIYFGPYSEKLWGISPREISSEWAAQRISLANIRDVFCRSLGKKKDMPKTYCQNFLYPKQGIGQICEYMAKEILKKGGRIHLDSRVEKVICHNQLVEKVVFRQNNQLKELQGDFFISTIPLPELIFCLEPRLSEEAYATAKKMNFRSIKFVHLMLNTDYITDNTWIYIPEKKYIFFRLQDRKNWSPTAVVSGCDALTLEIACDRGDRIWNAPDDEIIRRCLIDLEELGFSLKDKLRGYLIERAEHAYPVYSLDYTQKVSFIYNILSSFKGFISIGRQGLFRYNNMDHSLKMGILTARHILEGYPKEKIFEIATEKAVFDWQDPGFHNGVSNKNS